MPLQSQRPPSGGFPQEAFTRLAQAEPGNYWFEARNRLIIWAIHRYCPDAATLLDVGCGTGFVLQAVQAAFPHLQLSASDLMDRGLAVAQLRVPTATFFHQDACALDLPAQFDIVGAFDVLEHIGDDARALVSLHAAVRPGGTLLVTVPQHPWLWSRVDEYARHVRRYRRRELMDRLHQTGLEVVRATSFVSLLLPVMAWSRWRDARRRDALDPGREFRVSWTTNAILRAILAAERQLIRWGLSWPAGGALLAIARKPLAVPAVNPATPQDRRP